VLSTVVSFIFAGTKLHAVTAVIAASSNSDTPLVSNTEIFLTDPVLVTNTDNTTRPWSPSRRALLGYEGGRLSNSADWYSAVFSCRSRALNSISPETMLGGDTCVTGSPLPGGLFFKEPEGSGGADKTSPRRMALTFDVDLTLGRFVGRLLVGPSVSFKLGTLATCAG